MATIVYGQSLAPGQFSKLNIGNATGGIAGDGTIVAAGVFNSSPVLPAQTEGAKMIWYPHKAAFRAGYWGGSTLNEAMMGLGSTAFGDSTTASGYGSTAFGAYSIASGALSMASGDITTASGYAATAFGSFSTASGDVSIASGEWTNASGVLSIANGQNTIASGHISSASGSNTVASSFAETVIGSYNAITTNVNPGLWIGLPNDPLLQIGNGNQSIDERWYNLDINGNGLTTDIIPEKRSNALTVFRNGNMTLQGNLTLGGTITSAGNEVITGANASSILGNKGFVIASSTGMFNLSGSAPGLSSSGSPIFSINAGKVNFAAGSPLSIASPADSTSSLSGALTVAGGIGVGKDSFFNEVRIGRGQGNIASNTVLGAESLRSNTTGNSNSVLGNRALQYNTTGNSNVAFGFSAGRMQSNGTTNLTDPDNSVYLGANTRGKDNDDSNSIVIGANSVGEGANTTVIGNASTLKTRLFGDLVAGTGAGSPVLTQSTAANSYMPLNPTSIRGGAESSLSNDGLMALGDGASANAYQSIAIGNGSRCSYSAGYSIALTGGMVEGNYSMAASWGRANGEMSLAFGDGSEANGMGSIALGGMDMSYWNYPGNQSNGENSVTIGGVGNSANGFSSFATGFWTRATSYGAIALGSLNSGLDSGSNVWIETDSLFELGNGDAPRDWAEPAPTTRSNAITTLKNGQTTLTNKAWKADPNVAPSSENSNTEALVVEGNTRLKGKVVIEQVQGDISMGIYQ